MIRCEGCARLKAELEDIRAERDAWRDLSDSEGPTADALRRWADWRRALGLPGRATAILIWMAERPGRVGRIATLWEASSDIPGIRAIHDADADNNIKQAIHQARAGLRRCGLGRTVRIETVWGVGYRLDADAATALEAFVRAAT